MVNRVPGCLCPQGLMKTGPVTVPADPPSRTHLGRYPVPNVEAGVRTYSLRSEQPSLCTRVRAGIAGNNIGDSNFPRLCYVVSVESGYGYGYGRLTERTQVPVTGVYENVT